MTLKLIVMFAVFVVLAGLFAYLVARHKTRK